MNDTNTGDEVIADSFAYLFGGYYENSDSRINDGYKFRGRSISYMSDTSS